MFSKFKTAMREKRRSFSMGFRKETKKERRSVARVLLWRALETGEGRQLAGCFHDKDVGPVRPAFTVTVRVNRHCCAVPHTRILLQQMCCLLQNKDIKY
jgi:hypothetical protein